MKKMKLGILTLSLIAFGTINAQSEKPAKERKSAEEIFAKNDLNSDGYVEKDEFTRAIVNRRDKAAAKGKELKDIDIDKKFMQLDSNRDGMISLEEFKIIHQQRMENKNNPRKKFDKVDSNGNGSVDYDEFLSAMKKKALKAEERGKEPRNIDPQKAFAKTDRDHNGSISFEEFEAAREGRQQKRSEKAQGSR